MNNTTTAPKFSYKATIIGLIAGLILCFAHPVFILTPALCYFFIDRVSYRSALKEYNRLIAQQQEQERLQLLQEQRIKETKKLERQIRAEQKKNREDKASLYKNIYTVAGFVLATQQDLSEYIRNAEDVISHFKANDEERYIAVEAFNSALDINYDVDDYIYRYMHTIGKNRDYISCVLTYALMIATAGGTIQYEAKERLVQIGKALGSSDAALKRLFKSNGAEARFAREFDEKEKASPANTLAQAMLNLDDGADNAETALAPVIRGRAKSRRGRKSDESSYENTSSGSSKKESYTDSGDAKQEYQRTDSDSGANESSGSEQSTHSDDYNRISQALEILGLTSKATFDDLRKAHKKMMLKYHPDRLASQGLPEDMILIYTEKAKAVQVAFEYLKNLYNEYA